QTDLRPRFPVSSDCPDVRCGQFFFSSRRRHTRLQGDWSSDVSLPISELFVTGGATLDAGTEEFWRRAGFAVIQGYGMTETASLITVNHPFKSGRGSVGKILPGQEVKLGEGGEILVRGANVSPGYWRDGAARSLETG